MFADRCMQSTPQRLSSRFLVQAMKRTRTFQSSATDEAVAAQKVLALIKAHTPSTWLLEAHQGKAFFFNRNDIKDSASLVKEIVSFDPYIKKSTLELALMNLDTEHSKGMSASAPSQGYWAKQEAFVLKDLVMKSIKKAHNSCSWSRPRNMAIVVQALLDKKDGDSLASPTPQTPSCIGSWTEKHKRLVRRRSSDTDVICVSGPNPVQPGPNQQDTRAQIYALYGVTDSSSSRDIVSALKRPHSSRCGGFDFVTIPERKRKWICCRDNTKRKKQHVF